MVLDDLSDGCAHGELPQSRTFDSAADAEDFSARVLSLAERFKPVAAEIDDVRQITKCLNIVDYGRFSPKTGNLREGGLSPGRRTLALHGVDQCGFLAADITPGAGMDMNIEVKGLSLNASP